jgi:hypothetical protein
LLLNPQLLGVADHIPLEIDGSSTSVSCDQLFVDEVGRFVVVEAKNEIAGLKAMAQLLSYSTHWAVMPRGAMESGFQTVTEHGTSGAVLSASLSELQRLAGVKGSQKEGGRRAAREPWTAWPRKGAGSLIDFARRVWGDHALTMPGVPPRSVLIAPDFTAEVVKFAKALSARYVPIELVQASLLRGADGGLCLAWEPIVSPPPSMALTWLAARRLWRLPKFRESFTPNAWADHHSENTFSFSARPVPAVSVFLEGDGREVELSTAVPDGWYSGARRRKLRDALLDRLPKGHDGGRWLTWSFKLPAQARAFDACAAAVAGAVCDVLVPAAPA